MSKETPTLTQVMSISSASLVAESSSLPDFSEEDVMSTVAPPPAKRARVSIPSFGDIDLNGLWLKNSGPNKKGDGVLTLPLLGNAKLTCDLTPDSWLRVAFPFNTSGQYEQVSFLGHLPECDKPEGLNLGIVLDHQQVNFLKAVDEKLSKEMASISKASWHPLLTVNEKYQNTSVKVKVMLGKDAETMIKVIDSDKNVHEGRGWVFLKDHMGAHNFRGAKVKLTVRLDALWNVAKRAGLRLVATHLVLVQPEGDQVLDNWGDNDALLNSIW